MGFVLGIYLSAGMYTCIYNSMYIVKFFWVSEAHCSPHTHTHTRACKKMLSNVELKLI